jgi:hypothetical protein
MEALLQALEIIFEVQRKRNNEKITRNKKQAFQLIKDIFYFFLLWTLLTFKLHNFLIFYSFKKKLNAIGMPLEVLKVIFEL